MKRCIFCGKSEDEFDSKNMWSDEHIIPECLGNSTLKINNVCKHCNSSLGTYVDNYFVNHHGQIIPFTLLFYYLSKFFISANGSMSVLIHMLSFNQSAFVYPVPVTSNTSPFLPTDLTHPK